MERTNKETVDSVTFAVAAGVTTRIAVASTVNDYTGTVGTCPLGSIIKALWIEASYTKADSLVGRLDWLVIKIPSGVGGLTTVPGATGGFIGRKFIFLERKGIQSNDGLVGQGGSPARSAGWLMIPKRYQRMGEGDTLNIDIGSSVVYNFCLKVIYKWRN